MIYLFLSCPFPKATNFSFRSIPYHPFFVHLKPLKIKLIIMEYEILKLEINDGIAVVTISRPKAMNALNTRFFNEMDAMVAEVSGNKEVKAMVKKMKHYMLWSKIWTVLKILLIN